MSDFGSGHDLTVCEFKPASGSVLTAQSLEPSVDSVSPFLSASPLLMPCLSLSKINKLPQTGKLKDGNVGRLGGSVG